MVPKQVGLENTHTQKHIYTYTYIRNIWLYTYTHMDNYAIYRNNFPLLIFPICCGTLTVHYMCSLPTPASDLPSHNLPQHAQRASSGAVNGYWARATELTEDYLARVNLECHTVLSTTHHLLYLMAECLYLYAEELDSIVKYHHNRQAHLQGELTQRSPAGLGDTVCYKTNQCR